MITWPSRSALRPAPPYAIVPERALVRAEARFDAGQDLEAVVDRAFGALDAQQPALAHFVAHGLEDVEDETAQALGHYLAVLLHAAFDEAFGTRLRTADDRAVDNARTTLELDESMRKDLPGEAMESDDVVALLQPHVVAFLRKQVDHTLAEDIDGEPADVDLEDVATVYRLMLVAVLAFTQAVAPPPGVAPARRPD